jgi:aerobic-type carbon monoxide dehydrogenase small subunit (CoxS/CutS family)
MYPGACEVIVDGVTVSTSRIPLRRSSGNSALTVPQTARVRSVGPVRKDASPS